MHRPEDLAPYIDHTLLRPAVTKPDIERLCAEAAAYGFASVCVMPVYVPIAASCLQDSPVRICTVIGFPLGAHTTRVKMAEAKDAVAAGACELDMVIHVGALKAGDYDAVFNDIRGVVTAAEGQVVKVILETALLTDSEIVTACKIAQDAGAHFVKTSTGFGPGGATEEHVALMRRSVDGHVGVKASGGIRDFQTAVRMLEAGANRLGTSSGVAIVSGR